MQTIIIQRGSKRLIVDIFNIVIEPLGNSRQVVFFCRDKMGNKYRVPKSEIVVKGVTNSANKPSLKSAKPKRKGKKSNRRIEAEAV